MQNLNLIQTRSSFMEHVAGTSYCSATRRGWLLVLVLVFVLLRLDFLLLRLQAPPRSLATPGALAAAHAAQLPY